MSSIRRRRIAERSLSRGKPPAHQALAQREMADDQTVGFGKHESDVLSQQPICGQLESSAPHSVLLANVIPSPTSLGP